jgi:hypothetical protein
VESSPASCHSLPLRPQYSPQQPVLKHPQSMFFRYRGRQSSTLIQNKKQYSGFLYFNFDIFKEEAVAGFPKFNLLLISSWLQF